MSEDFKALAEPVPGEVTRYHTRGGKRAWETPGAREGVLLQEQTSDDVTTGTGAGGWLNNLFSQSDPSDSSKPKTSTSVSAGNVVENKVPDANSRAGQFPTLSKPKSKPKPLPPLPPLPLAERNLNTQAARSNNNDDVNNNKKPLGCTIASPRDADDVDTRQRTLAFTGLPAAPTAGPLPTTTPTDIAVPVTLDRFDGTPRDTSRRKAKWQRRRGAERLRRHEEGDENVEEDEDEAAQWAGEVARLEAETDRILAEQRRKDMVRQQQLHQALQLPVPPSPARSHKSRSPVFEKLSFFTRGKKSNGASLSPASSTGASLGSSSFSTTICPTSSMGMSVGASPGGRRSNVKLDTGSNKPRHLPEPGGKGLAPQTDTPRGASNGVERVSLGEMCAKAHRAQNFWLTACSLFLSGAEL